MIKINSNSRHISTSPSRNPKLTTKEDSKYEQYDIVENQQIGTQKPQNSEFQTITMTLPNKNKSSMAESNKSKESKISDKSEESKSLT